MDMSKEIWGKNGWKEGNAYVMWKRVCVCVRVRVCVLCVKKKLRMKSKKGGKEEKRDRVNGNDIF